MTADLAAFAAACTAGTLTDPEADAWLLQVTAPKTGCRHTPTCPAADAVDHDAAKVIRRDNTMGYSILCNHVVVWDDTGEIVPDDSATHCHIVEPHRPEPLHVQHEGEQS